MQEKQARKELVEVCHLAYQRGYICGTEGNFSLKLAQNRILSTPRGVCKGRINVEDLVVTDANGCEEMVARKGASKSERASTELAMHLAVYRLRIDIHAVVHAHPTVAVGFTVAGKSLAENILPEVVCTLGTIPVAPYATPGTDEVPESIANLIKNHDALLLDHHGALAVGSNIWDAFYKLETLEHHAQTMLVAILLGGAKPLPALQVEKLLKMSNRHVKVNLFDKVPERL